MGWTDFWSWLTGKKAPEAQPPARPASLPPDPQLSWIPADQNPYRVELLDLRPFTQRMMATSQNPLMATNAVSFGREDGQGFARNLPTLPRTIDTFPPHILRYPLVQNLADGVLYNPPDMDHKWALYFYHHQLIFVRSWTREVTWIADTIAEDNHLRVTRIHAPDSSDSPELTCYKVDFLVRSHALGETLPIPELFDRAQRDENMFAPMAFSMWGRKAHVAAKDRVFLPPLRPLLTASLLHIAVAQGKEDEVVRQLAAGAAINGLGLDGLPVIQWALARPDTQMLEVLRDAGVDLDARSLEGATALMTACQGPKTEMVEWLLSQGG